MIARKSVRMILSAGILACSFCPLESRSQTLRISAGTQLVNTGSLVLNNTNLVNDGIITHPTPSGNIWMKGNSNTTISGSGATGIYSLVMNKAAGTTVLLQKNISIAGALSMGGGNIDLGNSMTQLSSTAIIQDESENSWITSSGVGEIYQTRMINAPASLNAGNLGVELTSSQNLGLTTIRRGHLVHTDAGGQQSIKRYYKIEPAMNDNLNASFKLYYFDAELNNLAEAGLTIKRKNGNNWDIIGHNTLDAAANTVMANGLSSFTGIYTLTSALTALPLELLAFTAQCKDGKTSLQWITANEENTKHFVVQKSMDGNIWLEAETVPAKENTLQHTYSVMITDNSAGFFRLKMEDKDGRYTFSPVRRISCNENDLIAVGPNPTNGSLNISFQLAKKDEMVLQVHDTRGVLLINKKISAAQGLSVSNLNISNYPAGTYLVRIIGTNGKSETYRIIKK